MPAIGPDLRLVAFAHVDVYRAPAKAETPEPELQRLFHQLYALLVVHVGDVDVECRALEVLRPGGLIFAAGAAFGNRVADHERATEAALQHHERASQHLVHRDGSVRVGQSRRALERPDQRVGALGDSQRHAFVIDDLGTARAGVASLRHEHWRDTGALSDCRGLRLAQRTLVDVGFADLRVKLGIGVRVDLVGILLQQRHSSAGLSELRTCKRCHTSTNSSRQRLLLAIGGRRAKLGAGLARERRRLRGAGQDAPDLLVEDLVVGRITPDLIKRVLDVGLK